MIPERLELAAFGPFVEPQVLDFRPFAAHGLFVIHGPTGSGKSTLLDALTFALFGETSGKDRDGTDLVALLADGREARVALEFRHAGRRYRVERTPRQRRRKKRGDGFTDVPPTATLHRLGGETPQLIADGAAGASEQIRELLHCDATQFRQTVVLPQGQFRRVIEDDETRARTLADLFDTARFVQLQERLKGYAAQLRRQVQAALDEQQALREQHGMATAKELEDLSEQAAAGLQTANEAAAEAGARLEQAISAQADGRALAERFQALAEAQAALERLAAEASAVATDRARLDTDRRAREIDPSVSTWREAERARAERRSALEDASAAGRAAAEDRQAAEGAREALEVRRPARDAAQAELERLAPLSGDVERLSSSHTALAEAQRALGEREAASASLERERGEVRAGLERGHAEIAPLTAAIAAGSAAREAHARAALALEARHRLEEARAQLAALAGEPRGLALDDLWGPLALAMSARLQRGQPCPVCGSREHAGLLHPQGDGTAVEEVVRALEGARDGSLQRTEARARAQERERLALEAGGWAPGLVPDRSELEAAEADARARLTEVEQLDARHRELAHARDAARARLDELEPSLEQARSARDRTAQVHARAQAQLDALLERLDPSLHDPDAFRAALTRARTAVEAYDSELRETTARSDAAERAWAVAQERQAAAEEEVEKAERRHADARAEAEAALRDAGFRASSGAADPDGHAAALLDAEVRPALERRVQHHDAQRATTEARFSDLQIELAGREAPDHDALAAAAAAARAARDQAERMREGVRQRHLELGKALRRWHQLSGQIAAREEHARAAAQLAELANGTARGYSKLDLEAYVLRSILGDVLGQANLHLHRMTGGRYRLRLRDRSEELRARGLELDIEDRHAGGALRRVETLSGGEGFQASLALALGLSETAERTSGAVELGALFVDEGFGSLDADALDGVVRILRQLPASSGRLVGVITHVDELKRRIEAQVLVARDGLGSGISVATPS